MYIHSLFFISLFHKYFINVSFNRDVRDEPSLMKNLDWKSGSWMTNHQLTLMTVEAAAELPLFHRVFTYETRRII